jgi:hypothetical protein
MLPYPGRIGTKAWPSSKLIKAGGGKIQEAEETARPIPYSSIGFNTVPGERISMRLL